jgi:hypothetical protein
MKGVEGKGRGKDGGREGGEGMLVQRCRKNIIFNASGQDKEAVHGKPHPLYTTFKVQA